VEKEQERGQDAHTTAGETPALHLTKTGIAMGTVAYMSPEQARGEKLDGRTDVFSFGVVLYEMATGRQPFAGGSPAETLTAILRDRPVPPLQLNPEMPSRLEEIISKVLEKDRDRRYQRAADIQDDLKRLKRDTDSGRSSDGAVALSPDPSPGGRGEAMSLRGLPSRAGRGEPKSLKAFPSPSGRGWPRGAGPGEGVRRWPLALAGLLTVIAALGLMWFQKHRPLPPSHSGELIQKRVTFNPSEGYVQGNAISPDGRYLAYADPAGIHVKLLSTGEERVIPKPAAAPARAWWIVSSWFPDGAELLVIATEQRAHASVWKVSVLGPSPRQLRDGALAFRGAVSPDGTHIAFTPEVPGFFVHEIWLMGTQGDSPQKVFALEGNEWFMRVHWSPDGQRLAYIRRQRTPERDRTSLETCDLKGANRTVVVPGSDLWLLDFSWLPDGRIVYSRQESAGSNDANLWQVGIDDHTGAPIGEPKRITQSAGSTFWGFSASADGKRLALVKTTFQGRVYLGELTAGGTRLNLPRRLINDEADDLPTAWTPDSKAVLFSSERNGTSGIFKQGITQHTAEPVVTGPQNVYVPRLSADGASILYLEGPKTAGPSTPIRLMRIPVGGGAPQLVLETRNNPGYQCARAPASLCVVSELSPDGKQFTLTAYDPLKGRGKVLRTIPNDPTNPLPLGGTVSPDGTTFALSRFGEADAHIRLLSLWGEPDREFTVKGWPFLTGLDWSPDGKGVYCGCAVPQGQTLLYVDLKGNAKVLWRYGSDGEIWGVPSTDGRHLAIHASATNSNVWMLEGF
jgi:eukaryotic-like serine/threonine-protein kinase